jgi:radical SAM superfamily enzyme YgiQ (UPF0313 family)
MKITFKNNLEWKGSIKYFLLSFSHKDERILSLDREGRIVSFISQNQTENKITFKKAFNGTWLGIRRKSVSKPRERFSLKYNQIERLYSEINFFISELIDILLVKDNILNSFEDNDVYKTIEFEKIFEFWVKTLKNVNIEQNNSDKSNFPLIYSNVSILPPDRYGSLVIQVTRGCVYNKCSFCILYQGIEYEYKKLPELLLHIQKIISFMGESIGRFHSIFLGDANALTIPFNELNLSFEIINQKFAFSQSKISFTKKNKPTFEGIYSFLDVFTGFKLTKNHFSQLADLNLKMVYLGIESGSKRVLSEVLNKPNTKEKILKIVEALHETNIFVSVIFLIGVGGKKFEDEHINESLSLIREMQLQKNDIIYLSKLFIYENSSYNVLMSKNEIIPLKESELEIQYTRFKAGIEKLYLNKGTKPITANYEILDFIY